MLFRSLTFAQLTLELGLGLLALRFILGDEALGIGPRDLLEPLGIPVIKDLPGVGANLQSGASQTSWRARASLLYGYLTADRRFGHNNEVVSDANDPDKTGDGMRMAMQMAIVTAGLDAPWGTGLTLTLPMATMRHQNNTIYTEPVVTPPGLSSSTSASIGQTYEIGGSCDF